MGLLWVMDRPATRQYLRPGVDVEVRAKPCSNLSQTLRTLTEGVRIQIVLAGFTEVQAKGASQEERVRASAKMVSNALKSWSGIMYFNLNGKRALISLVESLTNPSPVIRVSCLLAFRARACS